MFKKVLVGVVVAVLLTVGVAGIVFAQGPSQQGDELCPFGGTCGGFGGGYGMGGFGYHGTLLPTVAEELGLTLDELVAALEEGKSIAEVAAEQDVALEALVAALVASRIEDLNQAVADGTLTQEQADAMIAEMTEHLTLRLESSWQGGTGGYGGGCGMMGGGWGTRGGGTNGGEWSNRGGYRGGMGRMGGRSWGTGTGVGYPSRLPPNTL